MGVRRSFWWAFAGKPSGPLGWVGAQFLLMVNRGTYRAMAAELALQPEDDLLDVGCGSASLLADDASHVRYVAGLDASEIHISMARRRLADRIAAGSAKIVMGDAARLPWDDGRFSVVTSLNTLKFVPDPERALQEMRRVLRPGGRLAVTMGENTQPRWGGTDESGSADAWGQWQWSDADAQRLVDAAGFADVVVSVLPGGFRLVRATKPVTATPRRKPRAAAERP